MSSRQRNCIRQVDYLLMQGWLTAALVFLCRIYDVESCVFGGYVLYYI